MVNYFGYGYYTTVSARIRDFFGVVSGKYRRASGNCRTALGNSRTNIEAVPTLTRSNQNEFFVDIERWCLLVFYIIFYLKFQLFYQ